MSLGSYSALIQFPEVYQPKLEKEEKLFNSVVNMIDNYYANDVINAVASLKDLK